MRRCRVTSGSSGGGEPVGGGAPGSSNNPRFYINNAPWLKITPTVVLSMSICSTSSAKSTGNRHLEVLDSVEQIYGLQLCLFEMIFRRLCSHRIEKLHQLLPLEFYDRPHHDPGLLDLLLWPTSAQLLLSDIMFSSTQMQAYMRKINRLQSLCLHKPSEAEELEAGSGYIGAASG